MSEGPNNAETFNQLVGDGGTTPDQEDDTQNQGEDDEYQHPSNGNADVSGRERPGMPESGSEESSDNGFTTIINDLNRKASKDVSDFADLDYNFDADIDAVATIQENAVGSEHQRVEEVVDSSQVNEFSREAMEAAETLVDQREIVESNAADAIESIEEYAEELAGHALNEMVEGIEDVEVDAFDELQNQLTRSRFYGQTVTGFPHGLDESRRKDNHADANSRAEGIKGDYDSVTEEIGENLQDSISKVNEFAQLYEDVEEFVEEASQEIEDSEKEAKIEAIEKARAEANLVSLRDEKYGQEEERDQSRSIVDRLTDKVRRTRESEDQPGINPEELDDDQIPWTADDFIGFIEENSNSVQESLDDLETVAESGVRRQVQNLVETYETADNLRSEIESVIEDQEVLQESMDYTNEEVIGQIDAIDEESAEELAEVAVQYKADEHKEEQEVPDNLATIARAGTDELENAIDGSEYEESLMDLDLSALVDEAEEYVKKRAGELDLDRKKFRGPLPASLREDDDGSLTVNIVESAYRRTSEVGGAMEGYLENIEPQLEEAYELASALGADLGERVSEEYVNDEGEIRSEELSSMEEFGVVVEALDNYAEEELGGQASLEEVAGDSYAEE